ncbi:MAG: MgtC/SapB family protein [Chloroflexi bacterium]|nr:MgtC/SapB family protein [Chloroflexota bacterium]
MLSLIEPYLRVLFAGFLGALIGWEREVSGKAAGLRTLIIVSVASALFVVAAQETAAAHGEVVDSVRALQGIAQGVGFLGAGLILQAKREVRGLTTAASVWAAAALGYSAGVGMYRLGLFGALALYTTLHWLKPVETRLGEGTLRPSNRGHKPDISPEDGASRAEMAPSDGAEPQGQHTA